MTTRHWLSMTALLCAGAAPTAAADGPRTAKLMLFVDATQSIRTTQSGTVRDLARRVLDGARPGLPIEVYLIGAAGESARPIIEERKPAQPYLLRPRLEAWTGTLTASFADRKHPQTCILNLFEFVATQLQATPLKAGTRAELVFVTDMVEDCTSTPLGSPVRLTKDRFAAGMKAAASFPKGKIDLGGHRVTFIVPDTEAAPAGVRVSELTAFWEQWVKACAKPGSPAPEFVTSRGVVPGHLFRHH